MKRIPGMTAMDQAAYRRSLIAAALGGVCGDAATHVGHPDGLPDRAVARAAISIADEAIDLLATEPMMPGALRDGFEMLLVYTVKEGDTLSDIAVKAGFAPSTAYVIAAVNRIPDAAHIEPGWKIILPTRV